MAATATKIFIFAVILAFTFQLVGSAIPTACVGTSSGTNTLQSARTTVTDPMSTFASDLIKNNGIAIGITIIGLAFGSNLLIFAGFAGAAVSVITYSSGIFNQYLSCFPPDFSNMFYIIVGFLSAISIVAWFGNKFGTEF